MDASQLSANNPIMAKPSQPTPNPPPAMPDSSMPPTSSAIRTDAAVMVML
jgi:hypothetical protein